MNIKLLTLGLGLSLFSYSQNNHHCGVTHDMDTEVKNRMMQTRAEISSELLEEFKSSRDIIYVPITFHILGKDGTNQHSESYADLKLIFDTFCRLQEDYAVFGVQFYLKMPFRYVANSDLYNNSHDNDAFDAFESLKVSNCLNIFVGPSVDSPVSSYYSPGGDFVFMLRAMMGYSSPTISHEVGHFFSLPHTFYGWEDIDARDWEGQNAPNSLGGWNGTVEKVARTGGNCNSVADGFCGTEADYISFRSGCPMDYDLRDPNGVALDPDETNIMSYYTDECIVGFAEDQQNAIIADIVDRGWANFSAPSLDAVGTYDLGTQYPEDDAVIEITSGESLTLTWDPVPNAEYYYVKVDSSHFNPNVNVRIGNLKREVIAATANPSYTLSGSELLLYDKYRWTVIPFTKANTCVDELTYLRFDVTEPSSVNDYQNDEELTVYPTIVQNGILKLNYSVIIENFNIHSIDGSLVGSGMVNGNEIQLNQLNSGIYFIHFTTDKGIKVRRVVVR